MKATDRQLINLWPFCIAKSNPCIVKANGKFSFYSNVVYFQLENKNIRAVSRAVTWVLRLGGGVDQKGVADVVPDGHFRR
jgi:hypothetical protein